jgi:signal transduction histidine kinase
MKLQAEVIDQLIENCDKSRLSTLASRMIKDANSLELQFDKILQLSKMELGGKITTSPININNFLTKTAEDFNSDIQIEIKQDKSNIMVDGDELALLVVFRNLFENSIRHGKQGPVSITVIEKESTIQINYQDQNNFKGNTDKLGSLFYKHSSPKGSGIGLYLSKRIIEKLQGTLTISNNRNNHLLFTIILRNRGEKNEQ